MNTRLRRTLAAPLALTFVGFACAPMGQVGSSGGVGSEVTLQPAATASPANYRDVAIEVEGQIVRLVNGAAEAEGASGSTAKVVTRYFGNEATGDLDADGTPDIAFLVTQTRGGSGTFYYVVVALKTSSGYSGTNAVLLGDRIAPQSTQISAGELIVNYADRKAGEPMTTAPSVGVSKHVKVVSGKLQVVP